MFIIIGVRVVLTFWYLEFVWVSFSLIDLVADLCFNISIGVYMTVELERPLRL